MGPNNNGDKDMAVNRKGFFFTITAILLLAMLIFAASLNLKNRLSEKAESIEIRVKAMDDFLKGAETDMQRGMYIAAFRAILSAEEYISVKGVYLNDTQTGLNELILNGTLNGVQPELMKDSTLNDWGERLSEEAEKIDAQFNVTVNKIEFSQSEPWTIKISSNLTINLLDKRKTAKWNLNKSIETRISVIGLEDPAYTVESFGRISIKINKTQYEGNYVSGADVSNLLSHTYSNYFANSTGPSFLMRLEGNFSNSTAGIESLIDLTKFQAQGIPVYDRSIVDYVYFSKQNTTNYRINNTPNWFKIDEGHLNKYQVGGLTI